MPSPSSTPRQPLPWPTRIAVGSAVAGLLFIGLNSGYFWARLRFALSGPEEIVQLAPEVPVAADEVPVTAPTTASPAPAPAGTAPAKDRQPASVQHVRIASLGIDAPLVYDVGGTSEAAFQKALRRGVVHYPGTALPGELGNAYFFGHSSDYAWAQGSYKTVFALLPKIAVGDRIEIVDATSGVTLRFVVREAKVVARDDRTVLSQNGRTKRMLTLQTSYPVGTALKRFVAIAELE